MFLQGWSRYKIREVPFSFNKEMNVVFSTLHSCNSGSEIAHCPAGILTAEWAHYHLMFHSSGPRLFIYPTEVTGMEKGQSSFYPSLFSLPQRRSLSEQNFQMCSDARRNIRTEIWRCSQRRDTIYAPDRHVHTWLHTHTSLPWAPRISFKEEKVDKRPGVW